MRTKSIMHVYFAILFVSIITGCNGIKVSLDKKSWELCSGDNNSCDGNNHCYRIRTSLEGKSGIQGVDLRKLDGKIDHFYDLCLSGSDLSGKHFDGPRDPKNFNNQPFKLVPGAEYKPSDVAVYIDKDSEVYGKCTNANKKFCFVNGKVGKCGTPPWPQEHVVSTSDKDMSVCLTNKSINQEVTTELKKIAPSETIISGKQKNSQPGKLLKSYSMYKQEGDKLRKAFQNSKGKESDSDFERDTESDEGRESDFDRDTESDEGRESDSGWNTESEEDYDTQPESFHRSDSSTHMYDSKKPDKKLQDAFSIMIHQMVADKVKKDKQLEGSNPRANESEEQRTMGGTWPKNKNYSQKAYQQSFLII